MDFQISIGNKKYSYLNKNNKSSKESSIYFVYALNQFSDKKIYNNKWSYNNLYQNDKLLIGLNYFSSQSDNPILNNIPNPVGIVGKNIGNYPTRSVYKREVWGVTENDGNVNLVGEKILHPVVIEKNINKLIDYNISTNRKYEYVIYMSGEEELSQQEIHFPITTNWEYWSISELYKTNDNNVYTTSENDTWLFKFNVEPGEQQQNISKQQQDTLGQYPAFSYGKKNYITSSVSCLLGAQMLPYNYVTKGWSLRRNEKGEVVWESADTNQQSGGYLESKWVKLINQCGFNESTVNIFDAKLTSNDSVDMLNQWKKICNSGNPKLYKNSKGQSFIIQITESSNSINESWDKQPITINFSWTEIANSEDYSIIQTSNFMNYIIDGNVISSDIEQFGSLSGNYDLLYNKPTINDVTLIGNKTDKDLYLEAEGNVKNISGDIVNVILDNNMTYNLGNISRLTTSFGSMTDEYYKDRQCSQAEINFTVASDFIYTPPKDVILIGNDVVDNALNAKTGKSYNIGFGYVDGSIYAVCGER